MSEDKKPRITSFAFSREFFNDNSLSSFLFDNKELMNFELYKNLDSNEISESFNSTTSQGPAQKPLQNQTSIPSPLRTPVPSPLGNSISNPIQSPISKQYDTVKSPTNYKSKYTYPLSPQSENQNQYKQPSITELNETASYYNIINAIKRENIKTINNSSKSINNDIDSNSSSSLNTNVRNVNTNNLNFNLGVNNFGSNSSFSNSVASPPITPLPVNINNPRFYQSTQQSYSAVDLSKTESLNEDIKGVKSSSNKPRAKSIHNVNISNDDDSYDYLNDSITDISFSKEVYEGSVASEKEKRNISHSISKSLKRAVSRNTKKSKKSHSKSLSISTKGMRTYDSSSNDAMRQNELPSAQYQEFTDDALVFKPLSGAITSYGEINNDGNSFDFDSMISSDQTKKITLTPNRINEIQKQKTNVNRLKPKNEERENLIPMNVINKTLGRNFKYNEMDNNMMDDYDSDDSIDRLLNEGKPKKKQETLWEFLKNSSPEDYMGPKQAKQAKQNSKTATLPNKSNSITNKPKFIPIKIEYSPFENSNNNNNVNNNVNNIKSINSNIPPSQAQTQTEAQTETQTETQTQTRNSVNGNLPISKRTSSRISKQYGSLKQKRSPNVGKSQGMAIAQTISNLAKTPDLSIIEDEYSNVAPITPPINNQPLIQNQQIQIKEKIKPKLVSVGTQYYISDTPLLRKKKVLFRPVDKRNPIAKYMFNHSFIETIYVSNSSYRRRRRISSEDIPLDFLARNFYYYYRYPSAIPVITSTTTSTITKEIETESWDYPERDSNPIAKYIFNGWDKKDSSSVIINSDNVVDNNVEEKELDKINDIHNGNNKKDDEIETNREINTFYTKEEKDEIINTLFGKIIHYLEDKEEKQAEASKTQAFAKLMFDENTKLQKELSKLRSELSAERVLRERAEEELIRYQNLMQNTLLK